MSIPIERIVFGQHGHLRTRYYSSWPPFQVIYDPVHELMSVLQDVSIEVLVKTCKDRAALLLLVKTGPQQLRHKRVATWCSIASWQLLQSGDCSAQPGCNRISHIMAQPGRSQLQRSSNLSQNRCKSFCESLVAKKV